MFDKTLDRDARLAGYRARLRFFQDVAVTAETNKATFTADNIEFEIAGPSDEGPLDSQELMLNARGLPSPEAAREAGERLRKALIVKSAMRRTGIDVGEDLATSGLSAAIKESLKQSHGIVVRDNVHGLDVVYDEGNVVYFRLSGRGSSSVPAAIHFPAVNGTLKWVDKIPERVVEAARILNAADRAAPPVVRLALSLAALETVAPALPWSGGVIAYLNKVLDDLDEDHSISPEERKELAQSVRPIRDFGRSGTRRVKILLERHGLEHLSTAHAKASAVRNKLLHGKHVASSIQQVAAEQAREVAHAVLDAELGKWGIDTAILRSSASATSEP